MPWPPSTPSLARLWPTCQPQWTDWAGTASAQEAADRVGPRTLFLRGPVPEGTGSEQSAVSLLLEALCPMADPCHGGGLCPAKWDRWAAMKGQRVSLPGLCQDTGVLLPYPPMEVVGGRAEHVYQWQSADPTSRDPGSHPGPSLSLQTS